MVVSLVLSLVFKATRIMSRLFVFITLLRESHELDINTSRRQAENFRRVTIFNRNENYVALYRLSRELIENLLLEIRTLVPSSRRPRRRLSTKVKVSG